MEFYQKGHALQCDILDELYRGIAEELKSRGDYSYTITNTREVDAFCSMSLACMEILWQDGAVLVTINLEEACIYVREKVALTHNRSRYSDKVTSKMELYDDKFFEKIHNILLINNINNTTTNKLRVGGGK
jgi:hypothetical protein